jgi:hypothetical protein
LAFRRARGNGYGANRGCASAVILVTRLLLSYCNQRHA